jgi:hypothetical protein
MPSTLDQIATMVNTLTSRINTLVSNIRSSQNISIFWDGAKWVRNGVEVTVRPNTTEPITWISLVGSPATPALAIAGDTIRSAYPATPTNLLTLSQSTFKTGWVTSGGAPVIDTSNGSVTVRPFSDAVVFTGITVVPGNTYTFSANPAAGSVGKYTLEIVVERAGGAPTIYAWPGDADNNPGLASQAGAYSIKVAVPADATVIKFFIKGEGTQTTAAVIGSVTVTTKPTNAAGGDGTLANPYVNPANPSTLPNGTVYVTYDTVVTKATRFAALTNGGAVNSSNTNTAALTNAMGATMVGTNAAPIYGTMSAQYTAVGVDFCPFELVPPAGHTETRFHVVMTMPTLEAGKTLDIMSLRDNSGSAYLSVVLQADGALKLWNPAAGSIQTATGILPAAGTVIRVAVTVNMSTSTIKVAVYSGEGTTQLGTVLTLTGAGLTGTLGSIYIGQVAYGPTGSGPRSFKVGAVRAQFGVNVSSGFLTPESTYTAP